MKFHVRATFGEGREREQILRNSLRQEIDKKLKRTSRVSVEKDKINSVSVSDKPKKQVNNDEDRNGKFTKQSSGS